MAWVPVISGMTVGAALIGVVAWRLNLESLEHQTKDKRAALKKLVLSGGIPPNQEVMDHLTRRQAALGQRYEHWLKAVVTAPIAEAAQADPQLYFQERFHEVQRTLERLALAHTIPAPAQLGFPKDLPPSDTVPRLLGQLALIEDLAPLIVEQEVASFPSLRVEDPEPVLAQEEGGAFLLRLPVRVRLTASLASLMKILAGLERSQPLIDMRAVRITSVPESSHLDIELQAARYLVPAGASVSGSADEAPPAGPAAMKRRPSRRANKE